MAHTIEEVMTALRAADTEGNTSDAQKLAQIADGMKTTGNRGALPFFNRAISTAFGAPVDITTAGLKLIPGIEKVPGFSAEAPFGGRKSIEQGLPTRGIPTDKAIAAKIGLREDVVSRGLDVLAPTRPIQRFMSRTAFPEEGASPETISEHVGAGIGEVTAATLPVGAVIGGLQKAKGLVGAIAKSIFSGMVKRPYLTMSTEITAGAGSGASRKLSEDVENPLAKTAIELGGGLAGALVPTLALQTPAALTFRAGRGLVQKIKIPFSKAGTEYRAGQFLKKQVADPSSVSKKVTQETVGELPPVVATGEKKLIAIYNKVRELDPIKDAEAIKKLSSSANQLEKALRKEGYGSTDLLREITRQRVASVKAQLDNRVIRAMENAQKKLDALPVATRKAQESTIVKTELERVMRAEQVNVQAEWSKVPKTIKTTFVESKKTYQNILANLSKAEKGDIPEVLRNSFLKNKKTAVMSIKEMQGLRSKLLEVARASRASGEFNKARIAGEVSDSLLDDMGAGVGKLVTPEGEQLRTAIEATRNFKDRFKTGVVGKILGFSREGGASISPELALDISVGRAGAKGAVDLSKITVTPEARNAVSRYITRSFTDSVTDKTGKIVPQKVAKWLRNNEEVLDQFPELRAMMQDAGQAQQVATRTKQIMDARKVRLQDPRISVSSRFLRSDVGKEVDNIFKSSNPAKMANQLMRQAGKDPSGVAVEGLRGAFVDNMIERASIGAFNEAGEQTLSGRALLSFIKKNTTTLKQVFEPEQIARMQRIGGELSKLETTAAARGELVMLDDLPSTMLETISRVSGATFGRLVGKFTGGGTVQVPGIFSQRFKNFATYLTKDRAQQLVKDAVSAPDGKLLQALLLPLDNPATQKENIRIVAQRIDLWLLGVGNRVLRDVEEEMNPPRPEPSLETL